MLKTEDTQSFQANQNAFPIGKQACAGGADSFENSRVATEASRPDRGPYVLLGCSFEQPQDN